MASRCLTSGAWDKAHEHFCHLCFDGTKVRKRRGGWWKCRDKKCVKLLSTLCKKHTTQLTKDTA